MRQALNDFTTLNYCNECAVLWHSFIVENKLKAS